MAEWKLFDGEPPETREHLGSRGWQNLECQPGWAQRSQMAADLVRLVHGLRPVKSITDLGCGDGSLLRLLGPLGVPAWGYDLGTEDVAEGQARGLDTRHGDILTGVLEWGELLVCTEVLEHLKEPVWALLSFPGRLLIASSPSRETAGWHNPVHAWAWDRAGYRELLERSGWQVLYHTEAEGGPNTFGGVERVQAFQAVVAVRP